MIGMVIVTHGHLADELKLAMEHVVGTQAAVATVCIGPDDDLEERRQFIGRCRSEVDDGSGVIMLTDMFGGTPSNLALSSLSRGKVEVLSGVNLPMLVKLAKVRQGKPLDECVSCAQAAGRKYITSASDVVPDRDGRPPNGAC